MGQAERTQRIRQLARNDEAFHTAALADDRRARPVGGQAKNWRFVRKLCPPVIDVGIQGG